MNGNGEIIRQGSGIMPDNISLSWVKIASVPTDKSKVWHTVNKLKLLQDFNLDELTNLKDILDARIKEVTKET